LCRFTPPGYLAFLKQTEDEREDQGCCLRSGVRGGGICLGRSTLTLRKRLLVSVHRTHTGKIMFEKHESTGGSKVKPFCIALLSSYLSRLLFADGYSRRLKTKSP